MKDSHLQSLLPRSLTTPASAKKPRKRAALSDGNKGMLIFLGTVLLLSAQNCIIKFCTDATKITAVHIVLFRAVGMVAGGLIYAKHANLKIKGAVPTDLWRPLLNRCLCGYAFNALMFASIYFLPLTVAVVLSQTQPIFVVVVMSLRGSERLTRLGWLSICVCLSGVVLLVSPETVFFWREAAPATPTDQLFPHFALGVGCALISSVCSALVAQISRDMGTRVDPLLNMVYFGAFIILLSPLAIYFTTQEDGSGSLSSIMGWLELKLFLVMALIGWMSQAGYNLALTLEKATRTQPLNYL